MTTLRTAAQQLLEALDKSLYMNDYCGLEVSKHDQPDVTDAIENLRAVLAEPQEPGLKAAHAWAAPKDRYAVPVLFNPYTGEPRDVRDVQSDPTGILIVPPGNVFPAAAKGRT